MNARHANYVESLDAALLDPVQAAAYSDTVIEMDDPAALHLTLRQVARARGMAEVARRSRLFRSAHRLDHPDHLVRPQSCSRSQLRDQADLGPKESNSMRRSCMARLTAGVELQSHRSMAAQASMNTLAVTRMTSILGRLSREY